MTEDLGKGSIRKISQLHGETAPCPGTTAGKTLGTGSEKMRKSNF